jgi:hypothetical protein
MNTKQFAVVASFVFVLILAWAAPSPMPAQASKPAYPSMAPLDQYLMDRDAEIALARSAAPEAISRDAKVLVLGRHGFETAVEGKNGFVCAVERGFTNDLFDDPEFWSPRIRGADCYNPPAARTVLPIIEMRARMVLEGLSKEQMIARIKAAYARKELPPLEPGAMGYMMSKHAHLGGDTNAAHLMLFTPLMDGSNWGADLPNSPVHLIPMFQGAPEPIDVFIVGTGTWSDGTAAR